MKEQIQPSSLYLVATPIGNLSDISKRAKFVLESVDVVFCEDTRRTGLLLSSLGLSAKLNSLHQHNFKSKQQLVLDCLKLKKSIALVSDAGMPLISDPGHELVMKCHSFGFKVIPVSGACAVVNAVAASGMCEQGFCFLGFVPAKKRARLDFLLENKKLNLPWVVFESPYRLQEFAQDLAVVFPKDHLLLVAREMTKMHEEIKQLTVEEFVQFAKENTKGEFVIVVEKLSQNLDEVPNDVKNIISQMRLCCSDKSISLWVSKLTGIAKNKITNYLINNP
jgi:16S rRNA (cytidine1402-2'-O)-methyltransferase